MLLAFSWMKLLYICVCLRWHVYLQSTTWIIVRIMFRPKTSWTRLLHLILWYVEHNAKAAASRIPIHVSASSTYVHCRCYVCAKFPSTWCILSTIASAYGFPGGAGLVLIPYSFSIKLLLNLWQRNYPPWSYVISTRHGYRTSHVVSTKFAIDIAFLLRYCVTSIHPVTGSIIIMDFNIK